MNPDKRRDGINFSMIKVDNYKNEGGKIALSVLAIRKRLASQASTSCAAPCAFPSG